MASDFVLCVVGILLLLVTAVDLVSSTFGRNGGPITKRALRCFAAALRKMHESSVRRIHGTAGMAIHFAILTWWTLGIAVGWFLVFHTARADARDVEDGEVTVVDSWMLSVSTVSGLGPGRVRLRAPGWIMVRTLAGLSSTLFVGLVVSFAVPLVQAAARKRGLATRLSLVPDERLAERLEGDASFREDVLQWLIEQLHSHRTYPTLALEYASHKDHDLAWQLVRLWRTLDNDSQAFEDLRIMAEALLDSMTYAGADPGGDRAARLIATAGWTETGEAD